MDELLASVPRGCTYPPVSNNALRYTIVIILLILR